MSERPLIFDVDAIGFESDVLEASRQTPVLVDFWAEWCGPCRSLAPVLEKVVSSFDGRVRLAKVDTDANRELAAAHGVRSLPTVKLFRDGTAVDEFSGAYPESQVRAFLSRQVEDETGELSARARELMAGGDTAGAITLLEAATASHPDAPRLQLELASARIAYGDWDAGEGLLRGLPAADQQEPEAKRLFALLHFHRLCDGAPDTGQLARKVEESPGDLEARLKLGARNVLEENYEAAMEQLLEIIRRNKSFRDGLGRTSMLSVFEILGSADPRVGRYRQLMAAAIY